MLKLEQQLDSYKNKNKKLKEELEKYKTTNNNTTNNTNILETNSNINSLNELTKLKNDYEELEIKYEEEKSKNKKLENELEIYKNKTSDLNTQIFQLKLNNNSQFIDEEKEEEDNLETARKEIIELKKKIKILENKSRLKGDSVMSWKSDGENGDDYEEEFDIIQLEEGIKKKNRSEDLIIDFPGNQEKMKNYQELEEKYNNLKEQVLFLLNSNDKNNIKISQNRINKICNLLNTSRNTNNIILEKFKK